MNRIKNKKHFVLIVVILAVVISLVSFLKSEKVEVRDNTKEILETNKFDEIVVKEKLNEIDIKEVFEKDIIEVNLELSQKEQIEKNFQNFLSEIQGEELLKKEYLKKIENSKNILIKDIRLKNITELAKKINYSQYFNYSNECWNFNKDVTYYNESDYREEDKNRNIKFCDPSYFEENNKVDVSQMGNLFFFGQPDWESYNTNMLDTITGNIIDISFYSFHFYDEQDYLIKTDYLNGGYNEFSLDIFSKKMKLMKHYSLNNFFVKEMYKSNDNEYILLLEADVDLTPKNLNIVKNRYVKFDLLKIKEFKEENTKEFEIPKSKKRDEYSMDQEGYSLWMQNQAWHITKTEAIDNIYGNKKAPISLIAYLDFQVNYSRKFASFATDLVKDNDKINFIFRHMPFNFNKYGTAAAESSKCAAIQGKFWEFQELAFDQSGKISFLEEIAEDIGLDMVEYKECMKNGLVKEKINRDIESSRIIFIGSPSSVLVNNNTGEIILTSEVQSDEIKEKIDLWLENIK